MTTALQTPVGYLHPSYAGSLAEFGRPHYLPRCDGWLLERAIPGTAYCDAMGCYPIFCCRDWSMLPDDLDDIGSEIVSLTVVTDPFADADEALLDDCFDRCAHFKDHYVAELDRPVERIIKKSHRATVRRALRRVEVNVCERPLDYLDQWSRLFSHLVRRHSIRGLTAFSRQAFAQQLSTPGLVMFEARAGDALVGLDLWYRHEDVAYGHLVAMNELGYRTRASYAIKWHVMHYFQRRVRWLDFGGGSGIRRGLDGLTAFKQGWSTGTKRVYLGTRVFQPLVYDELTRAQQVRRTGYFPAYRCGEFA